MKITLHKKIAAYFGYEFARISRKVYQDIDNHLMGLFEQLRINCVLDVGANMGQYAGNLRKAGYQGLIISFEPVSECYNHLKSREDENWKIMNFALGNKTGTAEIHVANKNVFSSILEPNEYSQHRFHDSARINHSEQVQIVRLDDLIDSLAVGISDPRIFLKLDTQGYDLEVLKGAVSSLKYIAGMQSEISCRAIYNGMPTHIESLNYFDNLGYEITGIFPLSHDKEDMSLLEFDCVFRKK
jgi:FkbM family methyltransferase